MVEPQQMTDLMGPFLDDPVYKVIILLPTSIVTIAKACCRDNGDIGRRSCKAEDKVMPGNIEILICNKENWIISAIFSGIYVLHVLQDQACIMLPPHPVIVSDQNRALPGLNWHVKDL